MAYEKLFTEFPEITTQQWEEAILKDLKGADYDKKLVWHTIEGFDVKPYYRKEDVKNLQYLDSNPAEPLFTRGYKTACNCWDIRQDFDCECLKEQNQMAIEAINRGVNSLGLNATQVNSVEDLAVLLKDICPKTVKINFIASKSYPQLVKLYVDYLKTKNINTAEIEGSLNFDSYLYAITRGKFYDSCASNIKEAAELINYCKENLPLLKVINVNAKIFGNSGGNISQELGFGLALANEYLCLINEQGVKIEDITPRMVISFSVGSNYFFEISKIRAARLLWDKIVEQYKVDPKTYGKIFIHCEGQKYNKTIFDAYVNMLRSTTETMSAAISGANSITVTPFDMAFKNSDEFSRRIAANQQILLREESYLNKVVDPCAGSYYIETLTDQICKKAWEYFLKVEKLGGYEKALRNNFIQESVLEIQALRAKNIAKRKSVIVGTNQYPNLTEKDIKIEDHSSCCCCQKQDKQEPEFKPLRCLRAAQPFEQLRLNVIKATKTPKVYNLPYGNLAMRNARQGFSTNFFGVAGYDIISKPVDDINKSVDELLKENPDILVLCSSDDEYLDFATKVIPLVKGKVNHIIVAGNPEETLKQELDKLGVTDYINVRTNALDTLTKYNNCLVK